MLEREVTISNKLGLHARASAKLVQLLQGFKSNAWLVHRGREINAKSIMGVMMLAAGVGQTIMIRTDDHAKVEEMAVHASVPVINGLTDASHPCQIVADLLTIIEQDTSRDALGLSPAVIHALWAASGLGVLDGIEPSLASVQKAAFTHPSSSVRRNAALAFPRQTARCADPRSRRVHRCAQPDSRRSGIDRRLVRSDPQRSLPRQRCAEIAA